MKDQRVYLLHAVDAIDAILEYTAEGREGFFSDRKTQDAVIRNVEILGQAVKGLSEETRGARARGPVAPDRRDAGQAHPRVLRRGPRAGLGCRRARVASVAGDDGEAHPTLR